MSYTPILLEDIRRTADLCVKCNICTSACPVVPETDLFPGPKYVGPQAQRFRDPALPSPDNSLDYCSSCGICTQVCPHGVRVMEINAVAKGELRRTRLNQSPLDPHLFRNWLLGRNELIGALGSPVAPVTNWALNFAPVRWLMERTLGIDHRAPFPTFYAATFRRWFSTEHREHREHRRVKAGAAFNRTVTDDSLQLPVTFAEATHPRPVVYFHGCATNYYEPQVGKAIVAVLEHNGFEVLLPRQNCCGLPMQSNGDFAGARRYAEANVRKLARYAHQGIPIVVGGSSCGLELKSDYREILGLHGDDVEALAENVYDINEFLWLEYEAGRLRTDFAPVPRYVPYHTSCHQKLHRIGRPALDLLDLIPSLRVEEMGADCCGITGTYGYKHEKYEISQGVGRPLFERIRASGADLAVCDNETCRWNIAANTEATVVHTVQLLAAAYGLMADETLVAGA